MFVITLLIQYMAEDFQDLTRRPRRLRRNAPTRAVLQETHVRVEDLIYPLFVKEGEGEPEAEARPLCRAQ